MDLVNEPLQFIDSITDTSPVMITITENPSQKILYQNRYAREISGYSSEEFLAMGHQGLVNLVHPEDLPQLQAYYKRFEKLSDREENTVEFRIRTREGSDVWLSVHGRVLKRDDKQKVSETIHVALNVTEEKRESATERKKNDLLETVFRNPSSVILLLEPVRMNGAIINFKYVFTNDPLLKGFTYQQIEGRLITEEYPTFEGSELHVAYVKTIESGKTYQAEVDMSQYGYPSWIQVTAKKTDDQLLVTYTDISAIKFREMEVFRLKNQFAEQVNDKYQTIYNNMQQGFCIVKAMHDRSGRIYNCYFVEVNPAFEVLTGLTNAVGKTILDLAPGIEPFWFEMLEAVTTTGKPHRFENHAALNSGGMWFEVFATQHGRDDDNEVAVFFNDITQRKIAENKREFLLKLSDAIMPLTNPRDIQREAMKALGKHLHVDRVLFTQIDKTGKEYVISDNYTSPGTPAHTGTFKSSAHPLLMERYRRGEITIIDDVLTSHLLTEKEKQQVSSIPFRATISVPVIKEKNLVAILSVHQLQPRKWDKANVDLLIETAERTWAAGEHAAAEEALRTSENKYKALFNSMDQGYCILQMLPDSKGELTDWRFVEVNPAFARHTGLGNADGRTISELAPGIEKKWFQRYGQVALTGESVRFEENSIALKRTFDMFAFRIGDPSQKKVAVLFKDITERCNRERLEIENKALLMCQNEAFQSAMSGEPLTVSLAALLKTVHAHINGEGQACFYLIPPTQKELCKIVGLPEDNTNEMLGYRIGSGSVACDLAMNTGENVISVDVLQDPRWRDFMPFAKKHGIRSWWAFPVKISEGPPVGTLSICFSEPRQPDERELQMAAAITNAAAIIISRDAELNTRDQAEKALRESETRLREMNDNLEQVVESKTRQMMTLKVNQEKDKLNAVIFAEEQERTRISEGLHDGVAQLLYAAQNRLQLLKGNTEEERQHLKMLSDILIEAVHDTRRIAFELMPPVLRDHGLETSLKMLMERVAGEKLRLSWRFEGMGRLSEQLEVTIYRIAQEILNNTLKHAHARSLDIHLRMMQRHIHLKMSDDGVGFVDKPARTFQNGTGLQSISNRIKLLNGKLQIMSKPNEGTTIEIQLPLK